MDQLQTMPLMATLAGILGLALVLAGYWMMRASARFACALILAVVGFAIGLRLEEPMLVFGATVGLGILGFFLGDTFYYLYVLLNGALAGYVLAGVAYDLVGWEFTLLPASIGALLGGVLSIFFERPLGIFGTSVTGAALCSNGLEAVLTQSGLHEAGSLDWGYALLFVLLIATGCAVQSRATKHLPPRDQSAQKPSARK